MGSSCMFARCRLELRVLLSSIYNNTRASLSAFPLRPPSETPSAVQNNNRLWGWGTSRINDKIFRFSDHAGGAPLETTEQIMTSTAQCAKKRGCAPTSRPFSSSHSTAMMMLSVRLLVPRIAVYPSYDKKPSLPCAVHSQARQPGIWHVPAGVRFDRRTPGGQE